MVEALIVSNIVLWLLVVGLGLMVLALARQVGVLHERVAPAGALMPTTGPKVGESTAPLPLTGLNDEPVTVGGADATNMATLVLFISPSCPVCKTLVPTAVSLTKSEQQRINLIFASDGDTPEQHRLYVKDQNIDQFPYVISEKLGMTYEVSKLPFAVLIGADGTLKSKGLVNNREHLESLVESMDTGIDSLQDYVANVSGEFNPSAVEQN